MYDRDEEPDHLGPGQTDERLKQEKDKDQYIADIQAVLNGPMDKEGEQSLMKILQRQRNLLLDMAMQTYIKKPNSSSLLDSINTLMSNIEKSVRDDRKERLKDRELEDNKANFANFVNALGEISNGRLTLPNYGDQAFILDPLKPIIDLSDDPDTDVKPEELAQGLQEVDSDAIHASFDLDEE